MNRLTASTLLMFGLSLGASPFSSIGQLAAQDDVLRMPANGISIRIQFGLKDKEPTSWDGQITLAQGTVVGMEVSPPRSGKASDGSWQLRTVPPVKPARKSVHDPKLPKIVQPVVTLTVDAPLTMKASVKTK